MRFAVLLSVCLSLATTLLSNGAEFSQSRDLPPLKLDASELDAILSKTHSFLNAVNGPTGEDSPRESVKLDVRGHEIEIPHFSLASSVAFPNEVFAFSYTYYQSDKPISSVTIDLGDSSRRVSVNGESADKIGALSNLLEKDLRRYGTPIGGTKFRRSVGVCLSMLFLTSLMIGSAYSWKNSKLQRIRNADLFCARIFTRRARAVEQVASRLCPLPTPFAFLSHQACVSNFRPCARSVSCRNSTVLFPFPEQAVAILLILRDVFRISPAISKQKCKCST